MWPFTRKYKRPDYMSRARAICEGAEPPTTFKEALSVYRMGRGGYGIFFRNTFNTTGETLGASWTQ